jgi:hypothetical protein
MTHEFLSDPDWRSNRVNPHSVGMPECVSARVSKAACLARSVKFTPKAGLGVGQSPDLQRPCENPIAFR